jgi:hypothetical protein
LKNHDFSFLSFQPNQTVADMSNDDDDDDDGAARSAAQLQAEWESFAELIGDSALQGPMPVDVMSIPLPDGMPAPPTAPAMKLTSHKETEQQDEVMNLS